MFKLYKEPTLTLSFADYALILDQVKGCKSALEFGPGHTTLALIEAGVEKIVTLEHDPEWFDKAVERFKDYPQVTVARYTDTVPVTSEVTEDFDIALVDSPKGFSHKGPPGSRKIHPGMEDCSRLNTCLFALERAPIVLLHDAYRPVERATLGRLNRMGYQFTYLPSSKSGVARIEHGEKQG